MQKKTIGAGIMLLAALALTACSGDSGPKAPTPASSTGAKPSQTPAEASGDKQGDNTPASSDCPALAEGMSLDVATVVTCAAGNMKTVAGFASTTDMMSMKSTSKLNPREQEMEMTTPAGSIIKIRDKAWVKSTQGAWTVADATSSDPTVKGLSTVAQTLDLDSLAASAQATASAAAGTGSVKVTGRTKHAGFDTWVLTGTVTVNGQPGKTTYYLTDDYVNAGSISTMTLDGKDVTVSYETLEWNKKQDIKPPM